jgi:hypothetical protein
MSIWKYVCLGMEGSIIKTDGNFWAYTEMSAIWSIPIQTTPLSEQFPLTGLATVWLRWSVSSKIYTESGNLSPTSPISVLPTEYRQIGWNDYFIFPVTRDDTGMSYKYSIHGKWLSEGEGVFIPTLRDCTLEKVNTPNHITILFMPPTGYTFDWKPPIDYRPVVMNYFIQFPRSLGVLRDVLMTTDTGAMYALNIHHDSSEGTSHDSSDLEGSSLVNTIQCKEKNCTLRMQSWALSTVRSMELFYKKE